MKDTKLAQIINEWFNNAQTTQTGFWQRNPVIVAIKNNLQEHKRWKRAPRGNPQWGAQIRAYNQAIRAGEDVPEPKPPPSIIAYRKRKERKAKLDQISFDD